MASSLPRGLVSHHPAAICAGLDVAADEPVDAELVAKLWRVYAASGATLSPEDAAPRLVNLLWRVWSGGHGQSHCHCHCSPQSKNRTRGSSKLGSSPRANISGATLARLFMRISDDAGAASGTASGTGTGAGAGARAATATTSSGRQSLPQRSNSRGASGTGKPLTPILKKSRPVPLSPTAAPSEQVSETVAAAATAATDTPKGKRNKNERVSFPGCSASSYSSSSSSIETAADAATEDHTASSPRANCPRVIGSSPRKRTTFATSLASLGEEPSSAQQQQLEEEEGQLPSLDEPLATSVNSDPSRSRQTRNKREIPNPGHSSNHSRKQPSLQESETWPFEKHASARTGPSEENTSGAASTAVVEPVPSNAKPKPRAGVGCSNQHAHESGASKPVIVERGFRSKVVEKQQQQQQQRTPPHPSHNRPTTDPAESTTTHPRSIRSSASASASATSTSTTVPSVATTTTVPASTSTTTISRSTASLSSSRGPAPSQLSKLLESERGR